MAEEVVIAIASYISEGELILTAAEAGYILAAIEIVAAIYTLREQQRRAANAQKDSYNNSLRDRYTMVRGATEPRRLVLGRQRVSGPIYFISSYGAAHVTLTYCVAIAAHEIDAIESIYFDNEQMVLDAAIGSTTANVVGVNRREQFSISTSSAVFTLQSAPAAGTVTAVAKYGTTPVTLGVSVAGSAVTVTGATAGTPGTVTISYQPAVSQYSPDLISTTETFTLNGSGNGSITLAHTPIGGAFVGYDSLISGGDNPVVDLIASSTVVGSLVTVTGGAASAVAVVSYQYFAVGSKARIRGYLGAPGQTADAGLIAALSGVWTSAHKASGVAYLVAELDFSPDAFPGGVPNLSAVVRGAKVYDPRTTLTAWSENPALLARYAALSPLCGNLATTAVNDASIIAAANICDTATAYSVNGQTYNRALYTAGLVHKSGTRPLDTLNDLTTAMAGKFVFVDGQLRVKAGSYVTPLQTLDETWLNGAQAIQIQPRANRADIFNVVTGKFVDETSDYQVLDYPRVASAPYITEDGREMPLDVQFNAVTFTGQTQQIVASMMRDARQGLRFSVLCNMRAYPVEVFDTLYVTLSRFGWVNKPFEVMDVTWSLDGGIQLTLKETSSTTWALGTTFADVDPAPNTLLPAPFTVATLAGLSVTSGASTMKQNTDGSVQNRMLASWTPFTDVGVLNGGGVEISWGLATQAEALWYRMEVSGSQSQAYLPNVHLSDIYLVKARGFNSLVRGKWSSTVKHTVVGRIGAPGNVAGLTATNVNGDGIISWTPSADPDYAFTELRVGASYAAGTRIARITGSAYLWLYTSAATYTVWAAHYNFSGVASVTPASASITLTVPTLGGLDAASGTKLGGIATGATKNIVTYSVSAPVSPVDGDIWVDTSAAQQVVKVRVSGAWQVSATYGATFGVNISGQAGTSDIAVSAVTDVLMNTIATITPTGPWTTGTSQIVRVFPAAGWYEITLTARYVVSAFTSADKLRIWFSNSGSGTNYGDSFPEYTISANSQVIMVSQSLTVNLTGGGPWQVTILTDLLNGTSAGTINNLTLRTTQIKR